MIRIAGWWRAWSHLLAGQDGGEEEEDAGEAAEQGARQARELLEAQLESEAAARAELQHREREFTEQVAALQADYDTFLQEILSLICGGGAGEAVAGREDVVRRVRLLLQSETQLKKQVSELEKKEAVKYHA